MCFLDDIALERHVNDVFLEVSQQAASFPDNLIDAFRIVEAFRFYLKNSNFTSNLLKQIDPNVTIFPAHRCFE